MRQASLRVVLGRALAAVLAGRLSVNLRDQFTSAAAFAEGDDPAQWARRTSALLDLIGNPTRVLSALGKAGHRQA
ncbi:hypothetical protein AB0465_13845 [Streptomyces griseoviridis]|uniref:hypothetical protein n=1 Tax=Streptomyces griseoviridis TaxID=45398 RepID=UPI003402C93A